MLPWVNREVWVSGLEQGLWVLEAKQGYKTHPEEANSAGLTVTLT